MLMAADPQLLAAHQTLPSELATCKHEHMNISITTTSNIIITQSQRQELYFKYENAGYWKIPLA